MLRRIVDWRKLDRSDLDSSEADRNFENHTNLSHPEVDEIRTHANSNVKAAASKLQSLWKKDAKNRLDNNSDPSPPPHRGVNWQWISNSKYIKKLFVHQWFSLASILAALRGLAGRGSGFRVAKLRLI